ncbi:unnamed protein product, partial [Scytosiphon promiscuus]
ALPLALHEARSREAARERAGSAPSPGEFGSQFLQKYHRKSTSPLVSIMASCGNPEHAALESELNDALEEALQMEERLAAYEAAGAGAVGDLGGGGGGVAAKALEEITALTEQAGTLEKERDAYEQDYLNQKDRVDNLETQLEEKDQKTKDLDKLRRKLEEDLENSRKLLQTERTKAADAQKRAGGADKTRRTEQRDQIKVLQELQDLRERAEDLEAQVKERDVLVEELVLSNQAQMERNETLTVQNEDLRGDFNEASQLLEEKKREMLDCHDQLEVAREAEEEYERRLDEEEAKGRRKVHALEDEVRAEKAVVTQLREEAARAKERAGGGGQRERELEQLKAEVERLGRELHQQSTAFEQAGLDLEVLMQELELERRKNRDLPHEIRQAEAHKAEALEAKVRIMSVELETEKQRYSELEERKGRLEAQLQETEDWKRTYEQGHGLVDAVQFQKKLKNDLHRLEVELEQRSLKARRRDEGDQPLMLTLTCQRLKEEAGRPHDFSYGDLAAVKETQAGEVARMKAVATELQTQVDDLNDERVRLLKKLRDGAGASGGAASRVGKEGEGDGGEPRDVRQASGDSEAAQLSEAVKRLALEVGRRDAQIEKLERSLLALGGNETVFSEEAVVAAGGGVKSVSPPAGEAPTAVTQGAVPVASSGLPPSGAAPLSSVSDAASNGGGTLASSLAGGDATGGSESAALPTREDFDELAKENKSLREALTAMAIERGAENAKARSAGDGKPPENGLQGGGNGSSSDSGQVSTAGAGTAATPAAAKETQAQEEEDVAGKLQKEATDKRVDELTRVNETIMRQLQALMARKDSPREAARRAGRAGGGGGPTSAATAAAAGGGREGDKTTPAAAVQVDMQRLIAEMGDLRQMVAGGFANKNTKNVQYPGIAAPFSPPGVPKSNGSAATNGGPALTSAADGPGAGAEARKKGDSGGRDGGGDKGGSVPAPSNGCEEAFSNQKPLQQPEEQPRGPQTAQGQEDLRWRLRRLNLPPEDWAEDVREVNVQLVQALEQLQEREAELDEHEELITRYETHLSDMRAQAANLYRDYADREKEMDAKQKAFKEELAGLREERDALAVRARRLEEVLNVEDEAAEDPTAPHRALRDLSRKVTVFEVNEAVMARRYASVKEQLQMESEAKDASERDFVEMSTASKTRVLYLEQWKAGASARLVRLQQRLDVSVPEQDFVCARRELEQLQEEFLALLQSSAESRVQVAKLNALPERVRRLEEDLSSAKVSLVASEERLKQAELLLEKADARAKAAVSEASAQVAAVAGGATQADFAGLLAEVAKHQGERANAEVQRAAAARRAEMAERRLASLDTECRQAKEHANSLEAREREARQHAQTAAAELIKVQNRFEGGLTREEALSIKEKLETELVRAEALGLEAERHKEIADIASEQTLAMNHQRKDAEDELSELRKAVSDLESRSDDDRLIGQLQRKLTATKVAYRSFARKHEMTKANLRRKTALLRVLESRLDKREDALHELHEKSQDKVAALKGALVDFAEGRAGTDRGVTGPDGAAGPERGLTITRAREIAARLSELTTALEASEAELRAAEQSRRSAEMDAETAEESRRGLETLVADLKRLVIPSSRPAFATTSATGSDGGGPSVATSTAASEKNTSSTGSGLPPPSLAPPPPSSTSSFATTHGAGDDNRYADAAYASAAVETAARRLLCLSEELRAAKLEAAGLRRQVSGLREDRRNLERKLCASEAAARTLEVAKAEAETRALLHKHGRGLLAGGEVGARGGGGAGVANSGLTGGTMDRSTSGGGGPSGTGAVGLSDQEQRLLVAAYAIPAGAEADFGSLDPEEMLQRLRGVHAKASSLARALEGAKAERDAALVKVDEAGRNVDHLRRALRYGLRMVRHC